MHTGFIFSGQQDTPKLLHTTNSSSTLHNTDYITRVPNMMTSKQFLSSVVSTMVSLFLSSKFHSKSPLQLDNYLLIWNSFTRFILLNYLRFLIDHLQTSPFHYAVLYECNGEDTYWVREKDLPEQVETG